MPLAVLLTEDAARDLEDLYDYIALHDASEKADYVLEQIEKAFSRLSEFPEQGSYPKELLALGIREYREVFSSRIASSTESSKRMSIFSSSRMVAAICRVCCNGGCWMRDGDFGASRKGDTVAGSDDAGPPVLRKPRR